MKSTGPTNPILREFIEEIRSRGYKENIPFLIKLADELSRQRRRKVEVNVGKLERVLKDGEVAVIPGKVLGYGILKKPITVYAWAFSKQAESKIKSAGGKALSLRKLIEENYKGSGTRIIV